MGERETRKRLIDRALEAAGWRLVSYSHWLGGDRTDADAVEEFLTDAGPGDYLLMLDGKPVADVEAKRLEVGPQNVIEQAKRYARALHDSPYRFGEYRLPFVYATNGELIHTADLRDPLTHSRQISRFHTPTALREFLGRDMGAVYLWQSEHAIADTDRPYQQEAVAAIENALRNGKRRMMVAMATGSGKTRVAISSIDRVLKSGYARRVLFIVDRRALAAQAVGALAAYEPEPGLKFDKTYEVYSQRFHREDFDEEEAHFDPKVLPEEYLTRPSPAHAFVYVCTIQRMRINLFGFPQEAGEETLDDEPGVPQLDIPIHAFDVIIADECHRGYTAAEESKWREVLSHFDATIIGMTATPAAHTSSFFGMPVYKYNYSRAVSEGYLVDYDAVAIQSKITMEGHFLRPGEAVGLVDTRTGQMRLENMEDERGLAPETLTREWTAPDRDRKIVQEVVHHLLEQESETGHFPKTLVFAANDLAHQSHAEQLVDILREELGRGDEFVHKITGAPNVDRPLEKIRRFRNRPEPGVVVTVDLLSTGVDIPALENIVFLRPVRSRILFEQMLGRGTRRCDPIHKSHFTVFDAIGVLEYFDKASEFTAEPPAKPTRTNRELVEDVYNNRDRDYILRLVVKRLQRVARTISGEGRETMKAYLPEGDIGRFARELAGELERDWAGTMRILRDPGFLTLLETYPRPRHDFIKALEAEDSVTSSHVFRTRDGRELGADDYIVAFSRFVRENPEHVEAIRILLDRPRDWSTGALRELREKMKSRPEAFTEEKLSRAYNYQLADIISLVHHAAEGTPLLSAEDRVRRAIADVFAGQKLSPEQEEWLGLIERNLVANLAIEEDDFRLLSFEQAGATWHLLDELFGGNLKLLIGRLNEAVAKRQ